MVSILCLAATAALAVGTYAATTTIDDGDANIEYRGAWVHNPISDPGNLNYGGSVTFTNVTGSTATYKFTGIAVAVFGAFEVAGTFNMASTYSIDDSELKEFMPANTIVRPAYKQKFFQSMNHTNGQHTLVITNKGNQFWLDYIVLTSEDAQTPSSTSSSHSTTVPASSATQNVQDTSHTPSLTTNSLLTQTTSSTTQPDAPSIAQGPHPTSESTILTSNGLSVPPSSTSLAPLPTSLSSVQEGSTAGVPTGAVEGSNRSIIIGTGTIVGITIGGVVLLLCLLGIGCWWRRRRPGGVRDNVLPYDPGLTALAPDTRKAAMAHHSYRGSSRASIITPSDGIQFCATNSVTHLPIEASQQSAAVPALRTDFELNRETRTSIAGFEPLGSPSSASPLISRHVGIDSLFIPAIQRRGQNHASEGRRQSVDGGVRIAGGAPGTARREAVLADAEVQSAASTLPPSYQIYPAV